MPKYRHELERQVQELESLAAEHEAALKAVDHEATAVSTGTSKGDLVSSRQKLDLLRDAAVTARESFFAINHTSLDDERDAIMRRAEASLNFRGKQLKENIDDVHSKI